MADLRRFVPSSALSWPGDDALDGHGLHRHVDGTLVFVDVSGFTALSERLAHRGKVGAEQLTDVLNSVFGTMLGLAAARGGTLLKFGGDALFLLFAGPDHPAQAAAAAVEMRSALAQTAKSPGPAGRLRLRMSVGVHSGDVDLFLVGESHRELVIVGPATTAVAAMEGAAGAGQILLSPTTARSLPTGAVGQQEGPGYLLRWRTARWSAPTDHASATTSLDPWLFVPSALRGLLSAADPESEHRTIGVSFVRYTGTDALLHMEGHQATASALHRLVSLIQASAEAEGVTFLASDLAEDGGKLILVAGFPTTADDDQGRLLRATRTVVRTSVDEGWPIAVRAGLNRGHVFAGAIGSAERATVTVMGDTVNLAARVMARAEPGTVLATPATLDHAQTLFATQAVEPFAVKGKSRPVISYLVGPETGTRPPRGLGSLPLLGRDAELARLRDAIGRLATGHGAVISLVGEAGMGKTRLLREALAGADSATVLAARAEPYGAATAYRPLRDPLRRLLRLSTAQKDGLAQTLVLAVSRLAPDLVPWLPLIGDVVGVPLDPTEATRDLAPEFRPDRTADAVVRLLVAAADGPVVVALDDAHYADDATAALISRLEDATDQRPWLVLAGRRDEDVGYSPTIGERIRIGPLPDETVRRLAEAGTAAAPLRPHEIDALVSRVGGNPLFLEETLRNLREHGDIDSLPSSLEGMVAAQIDALSPLARQVVRRASVLGRSFRLSVLRDLFGDDELAMDEATRKELADILEPDGGSRLRFRHALVRDAAYDSLPFKRRRQYHLRAASSTLRLAGSKPEAFADSLALHYEMGADHEQTWHWARVAAQQARAAFANPAAAVQYRRSLAAARHLPVDPPTLAQTWSSLGDVLEDSGEFDQALHAFRQAMGLSTGTVERGRMHLRAARSYERADRFTMALREIRRGEVALDTNDEPEAARTRAELAAFRAVVYTGQNRYRLVARVAHQAVDEADEAGATRAKAQALMSLEIARQMLGDSAGGSLAREARRLYADSGDLASESVVLANLGVLDFYDGRWRQAVEAYDSAARAFDRLGNPVQAAMARTNMAEIFVLQGRYADAEPILGDALRVLRSTGSLGGREFAQALLARVWSHTGHVQRSIEVLSRAADNLAADERAEPDLDAAIALSEAQLMVGAPERALDVLDQAVAAYRGEISTLGPAVSVIRAAALRDLGKYQQALEVAQAGLAEATQLGLSYEGSRLTILTAGLSHRVGAEWDESDVSRAYATLDSLGVVLGADGLVGGGSGWSSASGVGS